MYCYSKKNYNKRSFELIFPNLNGENLTKIKIGDDEISKGDKMTQKR